MAKNRRNSIRIPVDPPAGPSYIGIVILFCIPELITKIVAGFMLVKRLRNDKDRKRFHVYRRYANAIGERDTVSIRGLAAELGMPTSNVADDLQQMIDEGMIRGGAHIDRSHMTLYLDASEVEEEKEDLVENIVNIFVSPEHRARTVAEAKAAQDAKRAKAAEPAKTAAPEPPRRPPAPEKAGTGNEEFDAKLREIHQMNDAIEDRAVSERIERIASLTESIFRVVREKPERAEEVRKFMNYYLPTTLKLLKSYSLMEKQSYQGENIQASRKKIEDVLDTLVHAFEQQQDRLFKTEALDVETDISVLETMMASDGLLEQRGGLRVGGGH